MSGDRAVCAFSADASGNDILATESRLYLAATIVNNCVLETQLGFLELFRVVGSLPGRYLFDRLDQGIIVVGVEITV
jgi:hypothetical protein